LFIIIFSKTITALKGHSAQGGGLPEGSAQRNEHRGVLVQERINGRKTGESPAMEEEEKLRAREDESILSRIRWRE